MTRTFGGVCSSGLCDSWGLPQFSNMLHWLKTMFEDYVWRPLCLIMHDFMLKMCTVCKKRSQLHMLYVQNIRVYKILCTKKYLCVQKYFTWYFKNLLLLCLDSSKILWFDAFIKMMFWGATEPSKESILVSIITFYKIQVSDSF